jgi:hypothetical protein
LIITNCIVMGRAEAYAMKSPPRALWTVLATVWDMGRSNHRRFPERADRQRQAILVLPCWKRCRTAAGISQMVCFFWRQCVLHYRFVDLGGAQLEA